MRFIALLLLLLILSACSVGGVPATATAILIAAPAVAPTHIAVAPIATPAPPSVTPLPPRSTPLPPSPTPDPYADLAPLTIEGLRRRTYGGGVITFVRVLEETPTFTRYLIAYPSDGLRITGMLNRPHGDGPFPVVILNHGYYPLDTYQTGNGSKLAADYLARQGFLTIAPDFRSHAGSDDAPNIFRAGHVIDTLNLIPLAQALPDARPGKLLMWGHSNGGAITAKVIVVSDQIAAALIYSPASSNIAEDYAFRVDRARLRTGQPTGSRSGVIDRAAIEFPVTPATAPDLYTRLSPLGFTRYVTARTMIIWGDQDETVPRKWPEDLYQSLRDAGKPVEFVVYPGQPHSFNASGNAAYLPAMRDFFRAALGS